MTSILKAVKEAHLMEASTTIRTERFRNFLADIYGPGKALQVVIACFALAMSKIRVAAAPGTRKFLQQIQDMILTHCDPPKPRKRPLLAVPTAHPKLNTRTVLSALNLAHMHRLKQVGNVRLCKNWIEDRDKLREYRKHLFRGLKQDGHWAVAAMAMALGYDFDSVFEEAARAHPVGTDAPDGQETPPRSASPGRNDPFWEGMFDPPTPASDGSSSSSNGSGSDDDDADDHPPSAPAGKNAARNKRKAANRRLRKSAEAVVRSVYRHPGAGTPVGPQEQEATRATTPAPAPAVPTEEERKEARKAKAKAKKQRRKERAAAAVAAAAAEPPAEEAAPPPPAATTTSPAASSPPYSPPPAVTPSPPASPASVVPPPTAATAAATTTTTAPAPAPAPRRRRPVSPPRNSRLVSPSGAPVPLFWALDVEDLQEGSFVPAAATSPASTSSGSTDSQFVLVRPLVWWAARGQWVPLSADAEYLAPAPGPRPGSSSRSPRPPLSRSSVLLPWLVCRITTATTTTTRSGSGKWYPPLLLRRGGWWDGWADMADGGECQDPGAPAEFW